MLFGNYLVSDVEFKPQTFLHRTPWSLRLELTSIKLWSCHSNTGRIAKLHLHCISQCTLVPFVYFSVGFSVVPSGCHERMLCLGYNGAMQPASADALGHRVHNLVRQSILHCVRTWQSHLIAIRMDLTLDNGWLPTHLKQANLN